MGENIVFSKPCLYPPSFYLIASDNVQSNQIPFKYPRASIYFIYRVAKFSPRYERYFG